MAIVLLTQGVLDEGVQLRLEIVDFLETAERFVVAEESQNGIRFQFGQPLVRFREVPDTQMGLLIEMEFLGSRESPLRFTGRMGTEARRFARSRDIANDQFLIRVLPMQIGLEVREVEHSLP